MRASISTPTRACRTTVLAALLALGATLWTGALDVHSAAPDHAALGQAETVSLDASHARQAAHLEALETTEVRHCPACVLRLQSIAEAIGRPPGPLADLPGQLAPAPRPEALADASGRHSPSRAPPIA